MGPVPERSSPQHAPAFSALRYGVCFLLVFFSAVFQTSFFPAAGFFPATPDLLLSAVAGIALTDGEKSGAVSGIAAGVMMKALGGGGTMFMPLFYCAEGFILGIFGKTVFRSNVLSWTVYCLPLTAVRGLVSLLYLWYSETALSVSSVFFAILLPEAIMTFLFSYLSYFLVRITLRPFHLKKGREDPVQI